MNMQSEAEYLAVATHHLCQSDVFQDVKGRFFGNGIRPHVR